MKSEELRIKILKEFELGLIDENELSSLLMDFAMKYHTEQCAINGVVFNEAVICPNCNKYKRMQGNGMIHQLCECSSEVELPNRCKSCGRTDEERLTMTSMCGVSACPY